MTAVVGVCALVSGLGIPGCTILTNDALPDDAGKFEGGGDAASTACSSCVAQECTGPWAVCLTDSRCVALRGCNNPLGESKAARDQCFCDTASASSSAAIPPDGGADPLGAYAAFASCSDSRTCGKCTSDCTSACANGAPSTTAGSCGQDDGGTESGAGDAGVDDAGDDADAGDGGDGGDGFDASPPEVPGVDRCASCVASKCGDGRKACALGSECSAFLSCAYGCADAACVDACGKSFSTGKASAMELSSCTLTSCRSACGL